MIRPFLVSGLLSVLGVFFSWFLPDLVLTIAFPPGFSWLLLDRVLTVAFLPGLPAFPPALPTRVLTIAFTPGFSRLLPALVLTVPFLPGLPALPTRTVAFPPGPPQLDVQLDQLAIRRIPDDMSKNVLKNIDSETCTQS